MKKVRKVGIPCGRCRKKSKKHAARTPVGEGGKEGGSEKRGEGGKVVRKVGILCGRCRKKLKKTCGENAGTEFAVQSSKYNPERVRSDRDRAADSG